MNIFVENNGPYVYRSIFRKIPRLRTSGRAEYSSHEAGPACGASLDPQDPCASTPHETQLDPEPEPEPEPELELELELEPESEPESAGLPEQSPVTPPAGPLTDSPEPHPGEQQAEPGAGAEPHDNQYIPAARVLEVFEFLFNTVADALVHQPGTLNRIRRAFEEGLASAVDP